jgi:hypothetical protein
MNINNKKINDMKKIMLSWQKSLLLLFVSLATISCHDDFNKPDDNESIGEGNKEVIFQISVSDNRKTTLRSIDLAAEKAIERIDVLAFRHDEADDSKIVFDYYTEGYSISDKIFYTKARIQNYEQLFVVIANADPNLIKEKYDPSWIGVEKEIILQLLQFSFPENHNWTKTGYTKIPLWGESAWTKVGVGGTQIVDNVSLMRMVAKINIQIAEQKTDSLGRIFKLDCVYLYNGNTKGYIAPDADCISGTRVIKPTIPSDAKPAVIPTSKAYYNDGVSPSVAGLAMRGSIYTFEVENSLNFNTPEKATCLVVGGRYGEGNTNDTTYYRLDFLNADKDGFIDILRNYEYNFNITDVTNYGHGNPDEAYKSRKVNMYFDVVPWNNDIATDVVFIGQSYLNVSKSFFRLSKAAYRENKGYNVLYVKTNYPEGWAINPDSIVDVTTRRPVSWLAISNYGRSGLSEETHELILYLEPNETGKVRTATFTITAGHLRYPVIVEQTLVEPVSIELYRGSFTLNNKDLINEADEIIFPSLSAHDQSEYALPFHVRWKPKDEVLVKYMYPIPNIPIFRPLDDTPSLLFHNNSPHDFAVVTFYKMHTESLADLVTPENPFPEKAAYQVLIGTNGIETVEKRYRFRLVYYNCKVTDVRESYALNGSENGFFVKSNTQWRVKNIEDEFGIISNRAAILTKTGGPNTETGDSFTFRMSTDKSKRDRMAKIIFAVDDGTGYGERTDTAVIKSSEY